MKGHLEVLQLLAKHNIFPDQRAANNAALNGQSKMLRWLAQHNIHPDQQTIGDIARRKQSKEPTPTKRPKITYKEDDI